VSICKGRLENTPKSKRSCTREHTSTTTVLQSYETLVYSILSYPNLTHPSIPWLITAQVANPSVAALYEDALVYETGSAITSTGALTAYSGAKTGRSPLDKRIVKEEGSDKDVWWGPVNKPMSTDVSYFLSPRFTCGQQFPVQKRGRKLDVALQASFE